MEKKSYTVAIDLGSSNVVVAVGSKREDGTLGIEAVVSKPVEGVKAGRIDNIEQAGNAIREAVAEVESTLGVRITEAYAGISGEFVRCARHTDHVFTYDPQNGVNQGDVDALFDRMRNVQAPDDETIMERIPQHYMVDDAEEVRNPVGSFCKRLSSTFNFILCGKTPLQRLDMALRRLGIRMLGVFPNALATPEAVLSSDEKEEGVAVVDIGRGVTDVAVYYRGVPRYVATIPMGASAINRDIRSQSIPEKHVESLKCKYGSAVAELAPEDKLIRVSGRTAREAKDILLRNLATVGGSIYSRFGFSDVLTLFLAMDCSVELYKGGIVPLREYAERPYDRDIVVRLLVRKEAADYCYQSVRNSQTDIPVLTCAAARLQDGSYRFAVGARPLKAVLYEEPAAPAQQLAETIQQQVVTGSNMRGSAEYRRHLTGVLVRRAAEELENRAGQEET